MSERSDPPSHSNRGVAVVTGATSGIGRETAAGLVERGWPVVAVGRDETRCRRLADELQSGGQGRWVEPAVADLSLLSDVRRLAAELASKHPKLGILVNNAGAVFLQRETTTEGFEKTLALNVLAPFLLTRLLADPLVRGQGRVVNVASEAHRGAKLTIDDLQSTHGYRGFQAYGRSKLELILLTHEFARRFQSTGVSVIAVHPGVVRTRFGRNNRGLGGFVVGSAVSLFGISASHGARAPLGAATDPEYGGRSGIYLSRGREIRSSPETYDEVGATALWNELSRICGMSADWSPVL